MNYAALMSMSQARTYLLEVQKHLLDRKRVIARKRCHVAAWKVLQDNVVKGRARQVNRSAMPQAANYIWMAHPIQRHCFVLKI
jgi:hypothetical protein